ncbi:MAG: type II secretion system protein [Pseudomonadota bacterium]
MRCIANKRGFSIIELVLVIAIVGIAFGGLSVVLSNTTKSNIDLDLANTAIFLAREKMSETMAKDFASIVAVPNTNFGGDFNSYNYQINVDYVDSSDLNTAVVGPTSYKRIVVTVSATGWSGNITLNNLKTNI